MLTALIPTGMQRSLADLPCTCRTCAGSMLMQHDRNPSHPRHKQRDTTGALRHNNHKAVTQAGITALPWGAEPTGSQPQPRSQPLRYYNPKQAPLHVAVEGTRQTNTATQQLQRLQQLVFAVFSRLLPC
jgi:hypothetical protein